ncbi:macrophage erythroblast attacher isoform 1 [Moniliophthora roreri MCA 2997]|uniref:Macrophage erythroblast attacher isoform 1 n=1 Tax=Moniliophthora roreri (strain MCA 2997) TaxID=1381753 RepID=V2XFW7_MONRO|nr:macrophage erythroblast attacher isoform 1 [Moniliophthora roreri MCA 2997]KAI3611873.1 macrophage erythroblast attacher isoform 1 [Moniliophthora roreri]
MTLPITIPSSPSTGSSSDGGEPRTPVSPVAGQQNLPSNDSTNGSSNTNNSNATGNTGKRKPSRRANTAERRATHNAVERARRETLNGRFLDLAKLLPNLSQIRRPSKSAIVNSSIAHVHASRRHRALAARELRTLKIEADQLRRELNEWRDRAGIPRVEEPVRGEGFGMVLNQELEVIPITTGPADEEDDEYGIYEDGTPVDETESGAIAIEEQQRIAAAQAFRPPVSINPSYPVPPQPQRTPSFHGHGPMIASPTAVPFENPALGVYDSHVTVPGNSYPETAAFVQDKFSGGMPHIPPQGAPFAGYPDRSIGRERSASVTSSGSTSPPHIHVPHHAQARPYAGQGQFQQGIPQGNFEPGWGGLGIPIQMMQRGQNMQMGGGMGNPGVTFAMM